jgi:ABC-2 type transport system permease protein
MIAILWREWKVSLNNVFGLVAQFTAPLFILFFFGVSFSSNLGAMKIEGIETNYLEFFAPGLFGYVTFMIFAITSGFIRMDRQSGMLTVIVLSKTSLNGYYWGKLIFQIMITLAKIILLAILATALAGRLPNFSLSYLPLFLLVVILSVAVWFSFGMAIGVIVRRADLREVAMMLLILPLTFASSMYYDISLTPLPIRWLAAINPLTYTCNIFRGCYLGSLPTNAPFQFICLTIFAIAAAAIALYALRRLRFD